MTRNYTENVFVRPPKGENILSELGAPEDSILRSINPQYGLPEAPGYRWQNFKRWHKNDLGMRSAVSDPCFFYKLRFGKFEGVQVTQVVDSLVGGNEDFSNLEKDKSSKFECKPRTEKLPFKFNGAWIDRNKYGDFLMHQFEYCRKIKKLNCAATFKDLRSERGKLSYVSTCARPDKICYSAVLSQVPNHLRQKSN